MLTCSRDCLGSSEQPLPKVMVSSIVLVGEKGLRTKVDVNEMTVSPVAEYLGVSVVNIL